MVIGEIGFLSQIFLMDPLPPYHNIVKVGTMGSKGVVVFGVVCIRMNDEEVRYVFVT